MNFRVATALEAGPQDQDRLAVIPVLGAHLLVLADGAGGRAGGRQAAEAVTRLARNEARALATGATSPAELLTHLDASLASDSEAGESTAVIALVQRGEVRGASVGDSGAWLVSPGQVRDLTRGQVRKPLLGSGSASPCAFELTAHDCPAEGRLLLASDGLWKYASGDQITQAARTGSLEQALEALIACVRSPSGGLSDDVALILCQTR